EWAYASRPPEVLSGHQRNRDRPYGGQPGHSDRPVQEPRVKFTCFLVAPAAISKASSETSQMRSSVSFEPSTRGVIIFFSFAYCCLRNAFDFLFIARGENLRICGWQPTAIEGQSHIAPGIIYWRRLSRHPLSQPILLSVWRALQRDYS